MNSKSTTEKTAHPDDIHRVADFSDDDSDIECDVCEKIFANVKEYEQHCSSRKHYKMLKKKALCKQYRKSEKSELINDGKDNTDDTESPKCDTCDKSFSGIESYVAHLKSDVHAKNVRKQDVTKNLGNLPDAFFNGKSGEPNDEEIFQKTFARCPICEKSFSGPENLQQHIKSHKHEKKERVKKLVDEHKVGKEDCSEEDMFAKCETCQKAFSGFIPYQIHMNSAGHRKELLRAEAEEKVKEFCSKDASSGQLVCNECMKPFPDPFAFENHLQNNSHAKQKSKSKIFDFVTSHPDVIVVKSIMNAETDENVEEIAADEDYPSGYYFLVCKFCHMSFSGPENAGDHIKSKKHIKNVADKRSKQLLKEKLKKPIVDVKQKASGDLKSVDVKQEANGDLKSGGVASKVQSTNQNGNDDADDFELV